MGAMPLYLANILARANAYSRASATLRLSGTVPPSLIVTSLPVIPPSVVSDTTTVQLAQCLYTLVPVICTHLAQ